MPTEVIKIMVMLFNNTKDYYLLCLNQVNLLKEFIKNIISFNTKLVIKDMLIMDL